jgi:hypothetical protein
MSDKDKLFIVMSVLKKISKKIEISKEKHKDRINLGEFAVSRYDATIVIKHIFEEIEERTK